MSQRTDGFQGGVQAGTSATSVESKTLDDLVRAAARVLTDKHGGSLSWSKGYDAATLSKILGVPEGHIVGAEPDGGQWFISNQGESPLVAGEAKKQGAVGNAIERWYKNYSVYRRLGTEIYVTFCTGEGFFHNNSAQRILELAVALDPKESWRIEKNLVWNVPEGRLWFYRFESAPPQAVVSQVLDLALTTATARRAGGTHD